MNQIRHIVCVLSAITLRTFIDLLIVFLTETV